MSWYLKKYFTFCRTGVGGMSLVKSRSELGCALIPCCWSKAHNGPLVSNTACCPGKRALFLFGRAPPGIVSIPRHTILGWAETWMGVCMGVMSSELRPDPIKPEMWWLDCNFFFFFLVPCHQFWFGEGINPEVCDISQVLQSSLTGETTPPTAPTPQRCRPACPRCTTQARQSTAIHTQARH